MNTIIKNKNKFRLSTLFIANRLFGNEIDHFKVVLQTMNKLFMALMRCIVLFACIGYSVSKACTTSEVSGTWLFSYPSLSGSQTFTVVLKNDGSILGVPTSEGSWSVNGNAFTIYDNEFCQSGRPISDIEATLNASCNSMTGLTFDLEAHSTNGVEDYCRHDGTTNTFAGRKLQNPEPYFGPWRDNRTIASCNSDCIKKIEQIRTCIGGTTCVGPTTRLVTRNCEPGQGMCPSNDYMTPIISLLLFSNEPNEACAVGGVYDCSQNCMAISTRDSWAGDGSCDNGTKQDNDLITNTLTFMNLNCPAFNSDGGDCP